MLSPLSSCRTRPQNRDRWLDSDRWYAAPRGSPSPTLPSAAPKYFVLYRRAINSRQPSRQILPRLASESPIAVGKKKEGKRQRERAVSKHETRFRGELQRTWFFYVPTGLENRIEITFRPSPRVVHPCDIIKPRKFRRISEFSMLGPSISPRGFRLFTNLAGAMLPIIHRLSLDLDPLRGRQLMHLINFGKPDVNTVILYNLQDLAGSAFAGRRPANIRTGVFLLTRRHD